MNRVFRRGELRAALLRVLAEDGPGNGYEIMHRLEERIGSGWTARPGSIYPALLALEDLGQVAGSDEGGSRIYRLTDLGRRACQDASDLLGDVVRRASHAQRRKTLGDVLDNFARNTGQRSALLRPDQVQDIEAILGAAEHHILSTINEGAAE